MIEIGVNVLNPVRPKALDVEKLSGEYGDKLAFFGGICNQEVLPFKGPEEIDAHVKYYGRNPGQKRPLHYSASRDARLVKKLLEVAGVVASRDARLVKKLLEVAGVGPASRYAKHKLLQV